MGIIMPLFKEKCNIVVSNKLVTFKNNVAKNIIIDFFEKVIFFLEIMNQEEQTKLIDNILKHYDFAEIPYLALLKKKEQFSEQEIYELAKQLGFNIKQTPSRMFEMVAGGWTTISFHDKETNKKIGEFAGVYNLNNFSFLLKH